MSDKIEKMSRIAESLSERAERLKKAGTTIEMSRTMPAGRMGYEPRKKEKRISWKSISYEKADFRKVVMQFDQEHNLSRFIWRTAQLNGMKEITMSDVRKMLKAADETIWILGDKHEFDEQDPNQRKATWVMKLTDKAAWVALMQIVKSGYASSELMPITVAGEERKQRIWRFEEVFA